MAEFGTIVADPPWKYTKKPNRPKLRAGRGGTAEHHYPTMTTEEIAALPVLELAAPAAHLYLWVTNPVLTHQRPGTLGRTTALEIARGWGFQPITLLTWVKTGRASDHASEEPEPAPGMGWYFRGCTEHVLFCVRGQAVIPAALREPNVFYAPRGRHSEKPDALMDMAERLSPAPRLELFSRRSRFGWESWGNESLGTVSLVAG